MLRYLFLFTVFGALSMTPASADANAPIIPYFASFNHFDHHWFEWMPKNPKYEAVEAMVADEPDGKHFVLVFLTERKAPKHQTFYTNDQAAGASGFGTYRDISYQSAGDSGMARSMHISLQGPNDARIDWSITFPNDTPVMAAQGGLTNQSGHSADKLLLLFTAKRALRRRPIVYTSGPKTTRSLPRRSRSCPSDRLIVRTFSWLRSGSTPARLRCGMELCM